MLEQDRGPDIAGADDDGPGELMHELDAMPAIDGAVRQWLPPGAVIDDLDTQSAQLGPESQLHHGIRGRLRWVSVLDRVADRFVSREDQVPLNVRR
jgi:hypothetical protein